MLLLSVLWLTLEIPVRKHTHKFPHLIVHHEIISRGDEERLPAKGGTRPTPRERETTQPSTVTWADSTFTTHYDDDLTRRRRRPQLVLLIRGGGDWGRCTAGSGVAETSTTTPAGSLQSQGDDDCYSNQRRPQRPKRPSAIMQSVILLLR